jgi:RNA polymerase sigma-70 factor (ECF subfamily)
LISDGVSSASSSATSPEGTATAPGAATAPELAETREPSEPSEPIGAVSAAETPEAPDVDAPDAPNAASDSTEPAGRGTVGRIEARVDPDLDIVRLAQKRSSRRVAMGVLYERFRDRVYNVALRIVGNSDEAADVLQDVFVLLFRKIHRFRARAVFASWVYRITVNVALDHLRRRRRSPTPTTASVVLDGPQESETNSLTVPERSAASHDLEHHVRVALGALSYRLRIVIVLRYLEGLSYADIAEILDCSIGTVKSRLNRAHAAMRLELADLYDPEQLRA